VGVRGSLAALGRNEADDKKSVMRHRIFAAAVAIVTLLPTKPIADVSLSIIEYRVLTQLGQVRVTAGFVHDPEMQKAMLADLGSFERQGIVLIGGDSDRQFNRRETIGSHSVETTISVYPAVGLGYRGGLATADITVAVDGKKKIDCPYDRGETELADVAILPVDGMISIVGSYRGKSVSGVMFLNGNQTIDMSWLERNAR
jgi:hypothetical protein